MSEKQPGIIFDATNSWNGYNHQGKISMWYAVSEIARLYDENLTTAENRKSLEHYFLEIEHMEDFSIGTTQDEERYLSVHQVKTLNVSPINNYESAILGLLSHLVQHPNIEHAILHATVPIDLNGSTLFDYIKEIKSNPQYLENEKKEISEKRNDEAFRNELVKPKRGRPLKIKSNLIKALFDKYLTKQKLTKDNLDEAFDLRLKEIENAKDIFSGISDEQLKKVSIGEYDQGDIITSYCQVDDAVKLLMKVIKQFYEIACPNSYKRSASFVKKSYLWLLGKLDAHIIDRDLHRDLYIKNKLDRRILLSTIFDWLLSEEIDHEDDWYYLYYIKEEWFSKIDKYCSVCRQKGDRCSECNVTECKNKLGELSFDSLKKFVCITNPDVSGPFDMFTYSRFLGSGITDPFTRGLRDIPEDLVLRDNAVFYKDKQSVPCVLTAIVGNGTDDDKSVISSEILRNSNIYDLLMDYDCLISKNIEVDSIQDNEILQLPGYDSKQSEHIAHCKNVQIIPLDIFIKKLSEDKEES